MTQIFGSLPTSSSSPAAAAANSPVCAAPYVMLTPIVITRPNDTTAYLYGDVYGAAADARVTIPCAIPAGKQFSLRVLAVRNRAPAAPNNSLTIWPFLGAAPATVIGDNAPLALSDPDIVLLLKASVLNQALNWSAGAGFNFSADPTGRGLAYATLTPLPMPVGGDGNVYLYLWLASAYTPLASEVLTLYPFLFIAP